VSTSPRAAPTVPGVACGSRRCRDAVRSPPRTATRILPPPGAAIVLAAVVVGLAVGVPRRQFLTVVDNAATAAGMAAVVLAVILGGVRISRWAGGVHRLRDDPGGYARVEIRLAAGLAGIIPLALAVALTVVTTR